MQLDFRKNSHLQGLSLADSYPRDAVQVDVLIGADFYYSFVTGLYKKGSSSVSLIAVESQQSPLTGTAICIERWKKIMGFFFLLPGHAGPGFVGIQKFCYHSNLTQRFLLFIQAEIKNDPNYHQKGIFG